VGAVKRTSTSESRKSGRLANTGLPGNAKTKRTLSAEARTKIAAAQKARWAKVLKAAKKLRQQNCKEVCSRQVGCQTDLPNPSGVTLPLSKFQVARAAFIPAIIMVLVRLS
jgi:type IV secretory pathway VirB10-like protein